MYKKEESSYVQSELQSTRLSNKPGISILILSLLFLCSAIFSGSFFKTLASNGYEFDQLTKSLFGFFIGILVFMIIVPYFLGLPNGKTTLKDYLHTIGIRKPQSISKVLLVSLPCIAILFISWLMASFVYNVYHLHWVESFFISKLSNPSKALPPQNLAMITSIVVIFEEVVFRGIFLTMLLKKYSERKSIILSALAFGLLHSLNFLNGPLTEELLISVLNQILYTSIHGLFYGYLFVKIDCNLIPLMIIHYIGDSFISFFWYTPYAPFAIFQILMLLFYVGIVPTALLTIWIKFSTGILKIQKSIK